MPSLFFCKKCDILLHTSMDLSEPLLLKAQIENSNAILGGNGYAINVLTKDGSCPVCGFQANISGQNDNSTAFRISCNVKIQPEHWKFLFMHTSKHFSQDLRMITGGSKFNFSDRYLLAHCALRHFCLAGGLSHFGPKIGCQAILSNATSKLVIQTISLLVEKKGDVNQSILEILPEIRTENSSASPLLKSKFKFAFKKLFRFKNKKNEDNVRPVPEIVSHVNNKIIPSSSLAESIFVDGFSIKGGSCVVIKVPPPLEFAEAYFVAVVIGSDLENTNNSKLPVKDIPLLYFTLESTDPFNGVKRTILGEWNAYGKRRNYGFGPNPNVEEFVKAIERIWVSGIWKE
jgi:hypothetical protein